MLPYDTQGAAHGASTWHEHERDAPHLVAATAAAKAALARAVTKAPTAAVAVAAAVAARARRAVPTVAVAARGPATRQGELHCMGVQQLPASTGMIGQHLVGTPLHYRTGQR